MVEQTNTPLIDSKSQGKSDLTRYLPEIYTRNISRKPFILAALLASLVGGIAISYGSTDIKVCQFSQSAFLISIEIGEPRVFPNLTPDNISALSVSIFIRKPRP